jgi:hypothetical protein
VRGLDVIDNTFCSAGQFWPNGTLLNQRGFADAAGNEVGFHGVRYLDPCPAGGTCDFYEYPGKIGGNFSSFLSGFDSLRLSFSWMSTLSTLQCLICFQVLRKLLATGDVHWNI